jgi:hypothetical protein
MMRYPRRLVLVPIVCIALVGCENMVVADAEANLNVADFEAAWAWVDSIYPILDTKQIDWDSVYAEFRPRAEQAQGDEIFQVLNDMLSVLQDSHLYYTTSGGARFFPYMSERLIAAYNEFSLQLVRRYFNDELRVACNDAVEYGILERNLGYVGITNFSADDMMAEFPGVMDSLADTDGLIFDVRNNTGGDHDRVEAVVRSFIDSTMAWPMAFEKSGERIEPWPAMEPDSSRQLYANPVVVLINGASLSSGELFPEVMKQLPIVTVVGDTTAGAGCNDRGGFRGDLRLPSGKLIHIPTWCICRYDGVPWETVGIAPDIRVVQTEADMVSGVDRQLEFAIEWLQDSR